MVILPARDEGPRVGLVVRELAQILPGVELVVVENGSTDDTADRARAAGATVLHSELGYAHALKMGFAYAKRREAAWLATVDADGQHPPLALPTLIAALDQADLVVGSRFLGLSGYRIPTARRLAIRALSAWASFLGGQAFTDVTSGLRVMRPAVFHAFAADYPTEIADANVLVRAVRSGWRVCEVPVAMRERAGGRSMHDTPRSALFALKMARLCVTEAGVSAGKA